VPLAREVPAAVRRGAGRRSLSPEIACDPGESARNPEHLMTDGSVHDLLKQLHETLRDAKSTTPEDRETLKRLAADIQALLERTGSDEGPRLSDRLQAAVTRFEVSHPDLTAALAQVSKKLGDMGI